MVKRSIGFSGAAARCAPGHGRHFGAGGTGARPGEVAVAPGAFACIAGVRYHRLTAGSQGASMPIDTVAEWHRIVAARDAAALGALLADGVVFHSPVVHTPQAGRERTARYLAAAFAVLAGDSFRYVREIQGERDAALEFEVTIDGIHVNGVDLIRWDEDGRIVDFKVMLRPLKAVHLIQEKMAALLAARAPGAPAP
jgi:hypothetical protein